MLADPDEREGDPVETTAANETPLGLRPPVSITEEIRRRGQEVA